MSVYDNIAFGPRTHGIHSKSQLDEIVEKSLRDAAIWDELKDRLKKSALGLSGGQQQPVARDLRLISSALKMITDMERIGDQAADIAELATFMASNSKVNNLKHVSQMGQETMIMVINSIETFVEKNLEKAHQVLKHDDIVDKLFDEVKSEVIEMIHLDKEMGEHAIFGKNKMKL